jgi:hypothetical protein
VPKRTDGMVKTIHQVEIAKDTATKARSQAITTVKTIVNAPAELREVLQPLNDRELIDRSSTIQTARVHQRATVNDDHTLTIGTAKEPIESTQMSC